MEMELRFTRRLVLCAVRVEPELHHRLAFVV